TPDLSKLTPLALDAAYDGPKLFFTTVEDAEWTGVFEGLSRDYGAISIPSPDAAGPTMAMLTVIFDEVEVRGKTGRLELDAYGGRPDGTSDWEGNWVITSASGELEGLKGHGTWWGPGYSLDTPDECGVIYYDVRRLTRSGRGASS
ncbi:MAG: hypothetical protein OEM97_01495, partial [Acidimicrobiia bacterium]|nr:hypothetical protein [Acidimicrobiia bacterium]